MTLTQMQYFATVCQYQNISMAAKMLYISQPALSSSLSDLEREVGFKLFDRKSKGIQPTEEGLLFLKNVDAVLKRLKWGFAHLPGKMSFCGFIRTLNSSTRMCFSMSMR